MSYPPWWCLRRGACQALEQSPAQVDTYPPRPTRTPRVGPQGTDLSCTDAQWQGASRAHGTNAARPLAPGHWASRGWSTTCGQTPRWKAQ
jgi:hypothetical protein